MPEKSKILITGGAGFIGSHVVRYFSKKGIGVTCFVKPTTDTKYIRQYGNVDYRYGDILQLEQLKQALQGYDTIIHIAALAKDWGDYSEFYNCNVVGTQNVLIAAREVGVEQIILTGSISSYGEEDNPLKKDETSPFAPTYPYFLNDLLPSKMNFYRETKARSTQEALFYGQKHGMNVTVLEPVWVYGEREFNAGFYTYMTIAKQNIPYMPGSRRNRFEVIYAQDLARAYYLVYEKRLAGINRIIVGASYGATMEQIYYLFCNELGINKPGNLPKVVVYPVGFMMELFYMLVNAKRPPILTRGRVNLFYDNIEYSSQKAQELLGFEPRFSLEESLKRTVRWYKMQHLI